MWKDIGYKPAFNTIGTTENRCPASGHVSAEPEGVRRHVCLKEGRITRRKYYMRFAVPLANGKLTAHFGHCQEFALIDVEDKSITKNERLVPPPHEPGVLPKWLHDLGANVVIAGGMGHRAIDLFTQAGIKVITGAPVDAPEALVLNFLNNSLSTGDNLCAGGADHGCGGH